MQQLLHQDNIVEKSTSAVDDIRASSSYSKDLEMTSLKVLFSDEIKGFIESDIQHEVKNKNSIRALVDLADLHYSRNSTNKAKKYYLKALGKTNNSVQILRKVIGVLIARREFAEADRFFKILLSKSSYSHDISDYLNFLLQAPGLPSSNIDTFSSVRRENPNNYEVINAYGVALMIGGNYREARSQFLEIPRDSESYIHALNNLGVASVSIDRYVDSLSYFEKVIEIDPEFNFAYQNLASAQMTMGKSADALKTLLYAYNNNLNLQSNWLGHLVQLLIDQNESIDLATKISKDLVEKHPTNPFFLNNLGVSYDRAGETEEASKYYTHAVSNLSSVDRNHHVAGMSVVMMKNLMVSLARTGESDEAAKVARRLLSLSPDHIQALVFMIRYSLDNHNFDEAKKLSLSAYDVDPMQPEVVVNLSYLYAVVDLDHTNALDVLQRYVTARDDLKDLIDQEYIDSIYNNLAYNFIKLNRLEEAKKYLEKVGKGTPVVGSTKALYELYTGRIEKSRELFDKSINEISDTFNHDMNRLFADYEFGKYYYEAGDYSNALKFIKSGLKYDLNPKMTAELKKLHREVI